MPATFLLSAALIAATPQAASASTAESAEELNEPTQADQSAPIPDPEIIVEEPATKRERRNELRRFAQSALNKARFSDAIARFAEPMCPKVFGIADELARIIEARMRENAKNLGANRADVGTNCKHNTSVIFIPEEQGKAETWFDYDSAVLDHLLSYERRWVLEEKDPVRAWTYRPARLAGPLAVPTDQGTSGDRLAFENTQSQTFYASRLSREANPLAGAVVMIELAKAAGKSLTQLADYASMRTFGNARALSPDEVPTAQTILTLFQDDDAPGELTTFDRAVVSTLYDTSPVASQSLTYGNVARRALRLELEEKTSIEVP